MSFIDNVVISVTLQNKNNKSSTMDSNPFIYIILSLSLSNFQRSYCQGLNISFVDLPDWDYLMFSQRWPVSSCIEWEGKNNSNVCNMPKDPDVWIVHGLWPTKTGTDGPNDCNSPIHFDPDQLEPILEDLDNYWTNIEASTKPNSFWAHEWKKHGTCASVLPQLNCVYNYFKKGLELNRKFELTTILADANIVPNANNYTIDDFANSILQKLNVTPQIECLSRKQESFISEIRLCFNKSFDLISCTSVGVEISNCDKKKPIKYLKDIPGVMAKASVDEYYIQPEEIISREEILHKWYTVIKFLIWFTL
ncbi:hypothetical protein HHI36_008992 [Cryptolaemus montrouzieri]|uniref:Uncharacterized protein n=1 Tax=Cryptolaemus montrouzieri TaxID=559131 RepID=A0ABD2MUJ9_9CUCU